MDERTCGMVEELAEVASMEELKALWCFGQTESNEYGDAALVPHFKVAVARLKNAEVVPVTKIEELEAKVAELSAQIAAPKSDAPAKPPVQPVVRGSKKYRLLSTDVGWSTTPQVHALMAILGAHVEVGGTIAESDIVAAMEANVGVLATRQGGKRIWDYYKGKEGLSMHGNVEVVQ